MYKKLVLFIFLLGILSACTEAADFLAEDEMEEWEAELKDFDRNIKFPTYAPFDIDNGSLELDYLGPMEVVDDEIVPLEDDNKYQTIITRYFGGESPRKAIEVEQHDASNLPIENINHYSEENLVEFGDGLEGAYYFNGMTQILSWENEGTTYSILVSVETEEEHDSEPIPQEEILKIAASFEEYKK
ncbi:hypothetical protein CEY16_13285 [Halalkalibacillus sediminis]|uniref:DUF4367 domain-containing protein n=1 Tax=Halalkalibacillus sediminis TaxID=2018042 RepID=A0A2I0QR26_9BACI|nr:hypothetical protein [Halalkalibacillus sediminis]PKR76787.1 hypothetical protein CEY16_13285 [Halalkalibacillus sediminis]